MKRAAIPSLGLIVWLGMITSGCLFSPEQKRDPPPPAPPAQPFPDTPEQLLANFKAAYVAMDIANYDQVLAPDYEFILQPYDVPQGAGDRLTRAEDMRATTNMFSGHAVERPEGTTVTAISSIGIAELVAVQPWADVGPNDPVFPLTERGLYTVQLAFSRPEGTTLIVSGRQEFFVTARDSLVDGVVKPYYQLRGQRDLTGPLKTEIDSWGMVKNLYLD